MKSINATQLQRIHLSVLVLAAGTVQAVEPANGTAVIRLDDREKRPRSGQRSFRGALPAVD
jgi:hypothetical protein